MSADLTQLGIIHYKRSIRASRISVKIRPDGLIVTLPYTKSQSEATAFITSVHDKILQKQLRIRQRNLTNQLNEGTTIKTATFQVEMKPVERDNVFFNFGDGVLLIEYPLHADLASAAVRKVCWDGIYYFMKKEAKRTLPSRVELLADKYGFDYLDVKIQSGRTRWGSCSANKNINLSFYLMILSPELIDYVILHELCHTKEMNHGVKFWKLMDEVTGGKTAMYRKELKKYQLPE